jgi:hypothetical protein
MSPPRENNRRSGRIARPPQRISCNGRPVCQVARGDCRGRERSQPGLRRGQCAGVGSLCRVVPGSRTSPRRRTFEVTEGVLRSVFNQLYAQRVVLEDMILKPNMVLPGLTSPKEEAVDEVADATVKCLLRAVPAAVPGIAFLSGGQPGELASARLNAMNVRFKSRLPWPLSFSFARAIWQPALEIWRGEESHVLATQQALYHRASCNRAARRGEYNAAMERTLASHQGFPDSRDLRHSDSQKTPYQTRRRPARGHRIGDGIEARGGRHFETSGPAGSEMECDKVTSWVIAVVTAVCNRCHDSD